MSDKPEKKVLELIRRCLALASSANEHEAAAAAAKAQALLDKYNLSMADVTFGPDKGPEIAKERFRGRQHKPGMSYKWQTELAAIVGDTSFCKIYNSVFDNDSVTFVGQTHNVLAAQEILCWLIEVLERLADEATLAVRGTPGYTRSSQWRRYRNSFLIGAAFVVKCRLWERRSQSAEMRALVVLNDKAITEYVQTEMVLVDDNFKQRKPVYDPSSRRLDRGAYEDGKDAGEKVPLARSKVIA